MGILRGPLQEETSIQYTMASKVFFLLATVAIIQVYSQSISPQIDAAITNSLKNVFQGIDVSKVPLKKKQDACNNLKNSGQEQFMIDFSKKKLKELFGLDCDSLPSGANHVVISFLTISTSLMIAKFL